MKYFSVQVDPTFLKVPAKDLVKVARIGEEKTPPILRSVKNSVNKARCYNYVKN